MALTAGDTPMRLTCGGQTRGQYTWMGVRACSEIGHMQRTQPRVQGKEWFRIVVGAYMYGARANSRVIAHRRGQCIPVLAFECVPQRLRRT